METFPDYAVCLIEKLVQNALLVIAPSSTGDSLSRQATITVEALHQGVDFSLPLSRAKFEELNQDLFKNTLDVSLSSRSVE